MSSGPIPLLQKSDLDFAVKNYDFTTLTATELSDTPQLLDSIDALIAEFADDLAAQVTLSALMDSDLAELAAISAEIENDDFDSLLGDIAGAADAGDQLAGAGNDDLPIGGFFNPNV